MNETIKPKVRDYLEKVEEFLIGVYGIDSKCICIDSEETLTTYTGYGFYSEGGIRIEGDSLFLHRGLISADSFPASLKGYLSIVINPQCFAVYNIQPDSIRYRAQEYLERVCGIKQL